MTACVSDLNALRIDTDSHPIPQRDFSFDDGDVRVVFKNLTTELRGFLLRYDHIVGCVAWLTESSILDELATRKGVSIIVQKEDFLRPDMRTNRGFAAHLRRKYDAIPGIHRYMHGPATVFGMSCATDPTIEAIRCVGNHNSDKTPASPRSHHKFVVGCRKIGDENGPQEVLIPQAVWTGSFNFTKNAGFSFENAIITTRPKIAEAYFREWGQVAALSEPLNWRQSWAAPEWRIGT